jgi:hypothetical protein
MARIADHSANVPPHIGACASVPMVYSSLYADVRASTQKPCAGRFLAGPPVSLISCSMQRSKIEIYWNGAETAPAEVPLQVLVNDGSGSDYLLPYPCKLTPNGWVNAATGSPLQVQPTYWKPHVETRQGKKVLKLKGAPRTPR